MINVQTPFCKNGSKFDIVFVLVNEKFICNKFEVEHMKGLLFIYIQFLIVVNIGFFTNKDAHPLTHTHTHISINKYNI